MARTDSHLSPFFGLLTEKVQAARLRAAEPYLRNASRVLDIGCGLTDLPGRFLAYVGCDRNEIVLAENRRRFPDARFVGWDVAAAEAPEGVETGFDVILMLAILEHLKDPAAALARAGAFLSPTGVLVTTTPHPLGHLPLEVGARIGLLSPHADEEHEMLLDRKALLRAGASAGLTLTTYRRFLLGLNQLAVYTRG